METNQLIDSKGISRLPAALVWAAVFLFFFIALPDVVAGTHKRRSSPVAAADPDYVFALATANRFLHAWQADDLETGMVLLSDRVRHSRDPDTFEQFFAGGSDRAFEISRGQGNRGRYRFAVVLVTAAGNRNRRRLSEIVVVSTGKNDWVVDKLP